MERIAQIENAVIEHIRAAKLEYLRFVGSYGGELTGDWQSVVKRLPAVWVTFKGATPPKALDTARTRWRSQYEYTTIVACRSVRSEAASRQGHQDGDQSRSASDGATVLAPSESPCSTGSATGRHLNREHSPGTYKMLADVHSLVCMQDFGLANVDYFQPGRVRSLFHADVQGHGMSVFAQEWTVVCDTRLREPGQCALGESPAGYLPPEGETLPGANNVGNPAPLLPLETLSLQYWLKPPLDVDVDPPSAEDRLTLNIPL